MIDGKWIEGLGPLLSVAEAARLALQVRFEVVRYYLPLAMHEADRDLEHVHRLRVGTRRAGAALQIFRAALPEKIHKKARRTLRDIRRAAGAARDWDVFGIELRGRAAHASEKYRPGLDFLIGYAAGQRDAAQESLSEAGTKHEVELKDIIAAALRTIHNPYTPGAPARFDELGRVLLHDLLQEFGWAAGRNLDDYEHLHRVRILGKQLRYAMEIFAGCFPHDFREVLYVRVEQMQDILGLANDSHVADGRLDALRERLRPGLGEGWKHLQPGIESLLRFHRRRLPRQREQFQKWWHDWQQTALPRFGELMLIQPEPPPASAPVTESAPPGCAGPRASQNHP
jgi:CHAD domain-containing protein